MEVQQEKDISSFPDVISTVLNLRYRTIPSHGLAGADRMVVKERTHLGWYVLFECCSFYFLLLITCIIDCILQPASVAAAAGESVGR
jgi:hypothetical protein